MSATNPETFVTAWSHPTLDRLLDIVRRLATLDAEAILAAKAGDMVKFGSARTDINDGFMAADNALRMAAIALGQRIVEQAEALADAAESDES